MLRTFHRFQKHLSGFVLIFAIILAMSGFGVNLFTPKQKNGAIVIDDREITFDQFYRLVRATEQQYRRMFGKKYDEFAEQLGLNIHEQVKDRIIAEELTGRQALAIGMRVGDEERKEMLREQVFPMGYSSERYKALLQELNMTQDQFETDFSNSLLRLQFTSLVKDVSRPSQAEAREQYVRAETTYTAKYLEFDPEAYLKSAPEPSAEEVQKYYDEHQSDFELPVRVTYDYVTFAPEQFLSKVQVQPDEVDFMYTDNPRKYSTPETVKVRHVQINIPQDKDEAKLEAAKKKAEDVLQRAKSGTPMNLLALQFSDDKASKNNGGDLGWVVRGKMAPEFDEVAFGIANEGVGDLVVTDKAYYIVRVEEHKQPQLKPKEAVQAEIEAEIRTREAPAYASGRAQELYDLWTKGKQSLAEVAKAEALSVATGAVLSNKDQDPSPSLKNLSLNVIEMSENQKQLLIELPALSVLAEVKDRKEIEVQPLSAVKAGIVEILKRQSARVAAKKAADETLAKLSAGTFASIDAAAKANAITVKEEKGISAAKNPAGLFADREINKALLALTKAGSYANKVLEVSKKYYLIQAAEVTSPSRAVDTAVVQRYFGQQESSSSQALMASLLAASRYAAKIDVSPAVLGR